MVKWLLPVVLTCCIPTQDVVQLPNRTELVKQSPRFVFQEPKQCTRDHMAEYVIWFDDDLARKSGCYGALNSAVYCLQLYPCLEQRKNCEYNLERFDKCVIAGFKKKYSDR